MLNEKFLFFSTKIEDQALTKQERNYAPFIRWDVYSQGEIPFSEIALLAIALFTLVPIKLTIGVWLIAVYYTVCWFCTLYWDLDRYFLVSWRREVVVRVGRFLSRVMLFVLGFYWINEYYPILEEIKVRSWYLALVYFYLIFISQQLILAMHANKAHVNIIATGLCLYLQYRFSICFVLYKKNNDIVLVLL